MIDEPGTMVIVQGDEETKAWLSTGSQRVDDWLYELVDATVFFASDRIRTHAPGEIPGLVGIDVPHESEIGGIEGVAGVEPDITQETFHAGLGSDPADYPVYVEEGTGVYGEKGIPIRTIPGHVMGPFWDPLSVRDIYVAETKGQKPQHYTRHAFEETVAWFPAHVELALRELGKRTG